MAKDWPKKKPLCAEHVNMTWVKAGYYYKGCLSCGEMSAIAITRSMDGGRTLQLKSGAFVTRPWEPQGMVYPFPQGLIESMKEELPTDHVDKILGRIKK